MKSRIMFVAVTLALVAVAYGLTNPPTPNIDYAFSYLPAAGGLVMHGG